MSQKIHSNLVSSNEEIDLLDILFLLWRGKWTIIVGMILALLLASGYLMLKSNKWTSTAVVTQPDAGQMAYYSGILNQLYAPHTASSSGNAPQATSDQFSPLILQQNLFSRFIASAAVPGDYAVSVSPLDKSAVYPQTISLTAPSASAAQSQLQDFIRQVNTHLVQDYIAEINSNIEERTRELTRALETQREVASKKNQHRLEVIRHALKIAEASNITQSQLSQADNPSDDTLYLLGAPALQAMIANESSKPLALDDQYFEIQAQLLNISQLKPDADNLQSFNYVSEPDLPAIPTGPKKPLILLLAVMLGAIFGSAIVIGRSVLASYRLRKGIQ